MWNQEIEPGQMKITKDLVDLPVAHLWKLEYVCDQIAVQRVGSNTNIPKGQSQGNSLQHGRERMYGYSH